MTTRIFEPNREGPYPPSLIPADNWSLFTLEWNDQAQKFIKTPIDIATGLAANSDKMCVSYSTAVEHLKQNTVLSYRHRSGSSHFLGQIDIDHCVSPDGSISRRAQALMRTMDSYTYFSVSNGIHILSWLDEVPPDVDAAHKDKELDMEYYWMPRPIPITGSKVVLANWNSPDDIQERTQRFLRIHRGRFPAAWAPPRPKPTPDGKPILSSGEILSRLFHERRGHFWLDIYNGRWQGNYNSPSDADFALLKKFSWYSCRDRSTMDAMFSASPLSKILVRGTIEKPTYWKRPKWENANYRNRTLDEAIAATTDCFGSRKKSTGT